MNKVYNLLGLINLQWVVQTNQANCHNNMTIWYLRKKEGDNMYFASSAINNTMKYNID